MDPVSHMCLEIYYCWLIESQLNHCLSVMPFYRRKFTMSQDSNVDYVFYAIFTTHNEVGAR